MVLRWLYINLRFIIDATFDGIIFFLDMLAAYFHFLKNLIIPFFHLTSFFYALIALGVAKNSLILIKARF